MNLYKIKFCHIAPKGRAMGIKALLVAKNDEQVYNWIASEPSTTDGKIINSWREYESYLWNQEKGGFFDNEGNDAQTGWWDEMGNPEDFKERMLRLKGEINDSSAGCDNAYYGVTLFGWELLLENIKNNYAELIESGIFVVVVS
jgi:hypothetical protein